MTCQRNLACGELPGVTLAKSVLKSTFVAPQLTSLRIVA